MRPFFFTLLFLFGILWTEHSFLAKSCLNSVYPEAITDPTNLAVAIVAEIIFILAKKTLHLEHRGSCALCYHSSVHRGWSDPVDQ